VKKSNFIICAFYTPEYKDTIKQLVASADNFSYELFSKKFESTGSWVSNCGLKPFFLKSCLNKFKDKDILYLDADAIIKKKLILFEDFSHDIGVHIKDHKNRLGVLSGTIYLSNNSKVHAFVEAWCQRQKDNPLRWDQSNFRDTMIQEEFHDLDFFNTPFEYTKIFDKKKDVDPFIEHMQASRSLKHSIKNSPQKVTIDYKRYWEEDQLKNLVAGSETHPEGFSPIDFLRPLIEPIQDLKITEIGCGAGRLCNITTCDKYLGLDLNKNAVERAKINNPDYTFKEVNVDSEYLKGDICLAYTVFLHIDDDTLKDTIRRFKDANYTYILISEILGREWRRKGNPPVYNRDLNDYLITMQNHGYFLYREVSRNYKRYLRYAPERNVKISGLLFKRL
jgi:SAM-dependent methyltransferase